MECLEFGADGRRAGEGALEVVEAELATDLGEDEAVPNRIRLHS